LKRAKRNQEEEQLYKDAIAAANRSETLQQVLNLAGMRGDVEGMLKLLDKLEQLPSQRSAFSRGHGLEGTAYAISQAMAKRAQDKSLADVPQLFERYLATLRRYKKTAPSPRTASISSQQYQQGGNAYQIY